VNNETAGTKIVMNEITLSGMLGSAPTSSNNLKISIKSSLTTNIKIGASCGLLEFTSAPAYRMKNMSDSFRVDCHV
jgi:hypothetical protein